MAGASRHPSHGAAGDTARGPCLPAAPAAVPAAAPFLFIYLFFYPLPELFEESPERDGGDGGRVVKPEPRQPPRASARRAARGSAAPGEGAEVPLPIPHHVPLLVHPGDPARILQAPSNAIGESWWCHGRGAGGRFPDTPQSHLLEVPQGLRLGEGTHLQVPEEICLHQGARLGPSTWRGTGAPRLGWRGVLVALTPRPVLGSWEGWRASGSQASKAAAPHPACPQDVTGGDTRTPWSPGPSPGVMHAAGARHPRLGAGACGVRGGGSGGTLPAMRLAGGSTAGPSPLQGSLRRGAHG